jgi:hypothetical protein
MHRTTDLPPSVSALAAGGFGGGGLSSTASPPHSQAADHADADGEHAADGDEATSPIKVRACAPFRPPWRKESASSGAGGTGGTSAPEAPLSISKGPGADPGRTVSRFFQRTAPAAGGHLNHCRTSGCTWVCRCCLPAPNGANASCNGPSVSYVLDKQE